MLVDSHCHLNFSDFKEDIKDVIARARVAGVRVMQTICTGMAEFDEVLGIAEKYENIYCSVGVHPNDSGKTEIVLSEKLIEKTLHPKVIGIGETGLDYHYFPSSKPQGTSDKSDRESQKNSFIQHIAAARKTGLPLIVHTRDADEDTVHILKQEMAKGAFKGLIHCFTSSKYLAEQMIELGLYISVSGIISFKNAQDIRDTVSGLPINRLLVETDAPYLAPAPHRGKRNEPSFVMYTNKVLAELKGISEDESARATTENFFRLFNKAKPCYD
ncbi:MAG: TatD family hydrolase [Pseudomonadota bacterium]|nr:TatD family hydrolase [Pseudomonadota bacterium]MDE3037918.1 TatD family hydrolase [Pseudomonadota bacterium]